MRVRWHKDWLTALVLLSELALAQVRRSRPVISRPALSLNSLSLFVIQLISIIARAAVILIVLYPKYASFSCGN